MEKRFNEIIEDLKSISPNFDWENESSIINLAKTVAITKARKKDDSTLFYVFEKCLSEMIIIGLNKKGE